MASVVNREWKSEFFRDLIAESKAEGEAEGKGKSVLAVLEARGVLVPGEVRERVVSCTDLAQLDVWLRRAATAERAEDLFS